MTGVQTCALPISYIKEILVKNIVQVYIKEVFLKYKVLNKIILDKDT